MSKSYKSFKHLVLIALGLFLALNFSTLSAQTLVSGTPVGQSYYSAEYCTELLKQEMLILEANNQNKIAASLINANRATVAYYSAMVNYWAELGANNHTVIGSDIANAIHQFASILTSDYSDNVEGHTPLSSAEAQIIKSRTIEKLSH